MRDPAGDVDTRGDVVVRRLTQPLPAEHFLQRPAAQALVDATRLTPFTLAAPQVIESRKVSFISYPYEWTHGQLLEAAHCTLDVAEAALASSHEIKDATAFNVIFHRGKAEFCDHMSFEPIRGRYWWPYGQFLRHFLLPLAASKWAGIPVSNAFKSGIDGITVEQGKALLGLRRWRHRIGLALVQGREALPATSGDGSPSTGPGAHAGLFRFLRWQLDGLKKRELADSTWGNYEQARAHYSSHGIEDKRSIVGRWLQQVPADVVLDLGCNQGEFSLMAADTAREVISLDADEAALEKLLRRLPSAGAPIHTVLSSLDDPAPARGWGNEEYPALLERLERRGAQTVLALALLHHIVLGSGIPMERVAAVLARLTRRHLIVEIVPPEDEKARLVGESRNRHDAVEVFGVERQRQALAVHFDLVEERLIAESDRVLLLLVKKAAA